MLETGKIKIAQRRVKMRIFRVGLMTDTKWDVGNALFRARIMDGPVLGLTCDLWLIANKDKSATSRKNNPYS